jgi:hypothetical protein
MKRLTQIVAVLLMLLLLMVQGAHGQLLFRESMEAENYGRSGYHKYGLSMMNREANPRYDNFGNYILDGVRVFEWEEQKVNSKHASTAERYSRLYKTNEITDGEYFRQHLNNLVVVSESQKAFSSRLVVGNEIRVKFSPLTIDMAAMNGVRWDFNFDANNLTFISSRADVPLWFPRAYQNPDLKERLLPVYLTGGHFERQMGVLKLAANYVNTYRGNSSLSRNQNSITGTMSHKPDKPLMIVVKLEDASRFDGNGPMIYDIYPVINGTKMPELLVAVSTGSWTNDFYEARKMGNPGLNNYESRYMLDPRRIPDYPAYYESTANNMPTNYLMRREVADELANLGDLNTTGEQYLQPNGEEYLEFWFKMPTLSEDIEEVKFYALAANNYKFSLAEITDVGSYNQTFNKKDGHYYYTAKQAKGNVKDQSNYGWVSFNHGLQTANMIMGLRLETNIKDFEFVAEYNKNLQYRQFNSIGGTKLRQDADAYYVNVKKTWNENLTLGGEFFNMDPNYSTSFVNHDKTYYDMNVVMYNSWEQHFDADISMIGGADVPVGNTSAYEYFGHQMTINSVDDNDDKDQYPDFHMFDGARDMNGIFPGLDKNGNNRPDTNENDNLVPDYAEPFFLYNSDPDSYDFGLDMNNNNVIDEREDDDRPDYPYDLDTRGYHVFGSYGLDEGLKYTAGVANFEQPGAGGRTDVKYGRLEFNKYIPFFADVFAATHVKRVEDTIYDHTFSHERRLSTTLIDSFTYVDNQFRSREGIQSDPFYDQLNYRDSWVSASYFDAKLFRIPNMTVQVKLKYDMNHQNETGYQDKNDIIDRSQIFKADYRYYFNRLMIVPQVKFMSRKITNHGMFANVFHEQYFYPIIKAEYPLTTRSTLKLGAQGLPGLNSTVRNLVNSQLDYDERHYLIMVTNQSLYQGYDFSLNFGYEVNWQDMKGVMRQAYDRTDRVLFIRLVVGMEPVS